MTTAAKNVGKKNPYLHFIFGGRARASIAADILPGALQCTLRCYNPQEAFLEVVEEEETK